MYNDEYDDEEEQTSDNFFINFYNNNKVLVWIFVGIILFILLMTLLTRGGSGSVPITYEPELLPPGDVFVNKGKSVNVAGNVKNDPKAVFSWMSEDETIATVDNNGNITGLNYGKTKVIMTYIDPNNEKHVADKGITVSDGDPSIPLTDVSFKEGDLFMPINETYTIALILTPSIGYIESEEFVSANTDIVTVDNNGVVKSVGEGHTTITFSVNNGQFKKELNVFVDGNCESTEIIVTPNKISFDGELRKIKIGTVENLSYTVEPRNTDLDRLTWKSDDESVLTVEKGQIKGISEGHATITVTALNGESAKIDVEVESDIIEISDISLPVSDIYLTVGQSQIIAPIISPDNASNKALSYAILDSSIAYVSPNGTGTQATVTGYGAGTTTLVVRSIESTNPIERRINVIVTDPNGGNGGGNSSGGNNNGSGGGSSTSTQGFKISSSDANGERHVNDTYNKTRPSNNGAKAPVTITVEKTNSSVNRLEVLVCNYATSSTSCGSLGKWRTYDTVTFTLSNMGEYVIRVDEYDSNGNKTRTTDKFIWIKEGSSSLPSPTTLSCPKPETITIYVSGRVVWSRVSNATKYQVKLSSEPESAWTDVYGLETNMHSKIVASTGTRGVDVRTVCGNYHSILNRKQTVVYSVTVNKGTGISSVSGAGNYIGGESVTIKAVPQTGYEFSSWLDGSVAKTEFPLKFEIHENHTITARAKSKSGTNPAECAAPRNIEILNTGLVKWDAVTGATGYQVKLHTEDNTAWRNVTTSKREINLKNELIRTSGDKQIDVRAICGSKYSYTTVSKNVKIFTVTVNKGTGISSVAGGGNYIGGESVTINAFPQTGYEFSSWLDGGVAKTEYPLTFIIRENHNITARAKLKSGDNQNEVVCNKQSTPYAAMYCNDIYSSEYLLKTNAKTKLETGKYAIYYGCIKRTDGLYDRYECKYK